MVDILENPELRNKINVFDNRFHAGQMLATFLKEYEGRKDVIILAIPAGGVPVAVEVSKKLNIKWDFAVTRKLHIPWNKEAGFGAVSWDGTVFLNKPLVESLGLGSETILRCIDEEIKVIKNRLKKFRGSVPFPNLENKVVILVDDGLASGFSMLVTIKSIRAQAREIVVAVPTASASAIELIATLVDKIVCLNIRYGPFFAVADAYKMWYDLTDEDVFEIMDKETIN